MNEFVHLTTSLDNNSDHVTELNNQRPKQPFFFLKPPSSILLPSEGPVLRPKGVDMHFEVELALVMGKTLTDLDPNDEQGALDAVDSNKPQSSPFQSSSFPSLSMPQPPFPRNNITTTTTNPKEPPQATSSQST